MKMRGSYLDCKSFISTLLNRLSHRRRLLLLGAKAFRQYHHTNRSRSRLTLPPPVEQRFIRSSDATAIEDAATYSPSLYSTRPEDYAPLQLVPSDEQMTELLDTKDSVPPTAGLNAWPPELLTPFPMTPGLYENLAESPMSYWGRSWSPDLGWFDARSPSSESSSESDMSAMSSESEFPSSPRVWSSPTVKANHELVGRVGTEPGDHAIVETPLDRDETSTRSNPSRMASLTTPSPKYNSHHSFHGTVSIGVHNDRRRPPPLVLSRISRDSQGQYRRSYAKVVSSGAS